MKIKVNKAVITALAVMKDAGIIDVMPDVTTDWGIKSACRLIDMAYRHDDTRYIVSSISKPMLQSMGVIVNNDGDIDDLRSVAILARRALTAEIKKRQLLLNLTLEQRVLYDAAARTEKRIADLKADFAARLAVKPKTKKK